MGSGKLLQVICLVFCFVFAASDSVNAGLGVTYEQALYSMENSDPSTIDETIDSSLVVPSGNEIQQILFGLGHQMYTYNSTDWVLTNASADLFNFKGFKVGHHFFLATKDSNGGQPTWETFHPFSRVTGKAMNMLSQDGSIALVLLEATSNSGSEDYLQSTTFIQRLYTHDGLAPSSDVPAKEGDVCNSSYTALYVFSRKQTSSTT